MIKASPLTKKSVSPYQTQPSNLLLSKATSLQSYYIFSTVPTAILVPAHYCARDILVRNLNKLPFNFETVTIR